MARTFAYAVSLGLVLGCGRTPPPQGQDLARQPVAPRAETVLPETPVTKSLANSGSIAPAPKDSPRVITERETDVAKLDERNLGTGAVIDLSQTPAGALFEAKVLAEPKLTWLERSHIDKVVRELEVQALFSAEAPEKRARLGKLLKADVLVMLRAGEHPEDKKVKFIHIVICEGQRGLRLASEQIAQSGATEVDVQHLEKVLQGALARYSEKNTELCAVPAFLNQDLDFKYDHLRTAFAHLLEQHLLTRKGVLLVELAEAQALAREALLSGSGTGFERRLPLYFLGAFRNVGKEGARRMNIELKLMRGDSHLGTKQNDRTEPTEATKVLTLLADELADKVLASANVGILNSNAEIEQLIKRARAFDQLGNWKESLSLLETALLLAPGRADIHYQASHACAMLVRRHVQKSELVPALNQYRRGLEHLEVGIRPKGKNAPPIKPNIGPPASPSPSGEFNMQLTFLLRNLKPQRKEDLDLWTQVKQEERDMLLRLCRIRSHAGMGDEFRYLEKAVADLPLQDKYKTIRNLIEELKDLPHAKERTMYFTKFNSALESPLDSEFVNFVEELRRHSHPEIKAGGEELSAVLAKNSSKTPDRNVPAPTGGSKVAFNAVELVQQDPNPNNRKPIGLVLKDSMPLEGGTDFVVGNGVVFVMKRRGDLTPVWQSAFLNSQPQSICYDGRYVWFSVERLNKTPQLFVVNPDSLKTWEFSEADGLPLIDPKTLPDVRTIQTIRIAPLAPGRVCLAGSFGRAWLAIATFDALGGKSVKVFHEAPQAPEANVPQQWSLTTVAFEPSCMYVLAGPNGSQRILIGRKCTDGYVENHPLLVNPDTLTIQVIKDSINPQRLKQAQYRNGSVYYLVPKNPNNYSLLKIGFPGDKQETFMTGLPDGRALLVGDDLHVVDLRQNWWHGSLATKTIAKVGTLPSGDVDFIGPSNHYGVLMRMRHERHSKIYQVYVSGQSMRVEQVVAALPQQFQPAPKQIVDTAKAKIVTESNATAPQPGNALTPTRDTPKKTQVLKVNEDVQAKNPAPLLNPEIEQSAKQLYERGVALGSTGKWKESLEALEASLALKADQPDARYRAARACGALAQALAPNAKVTPENLRLALDYFARGTEHQEAFFRPASKLPKPRDLDRQPALRISRIPEMAFAWADICEFALPDGALNDYWKKVADAHRDSLVRLCKLAAEAGYGDERQFLAPAVVRRYRIDYPLVKTVILSLQDLPDARRRTVNLARLGYSYEALVVNKGFQSLVKELADSSHPEIKAAAEEMKQGLELAPLAAQKSQASQVKDKEQAAQLKVKFAEAYAKDISFQPIPLKVLDENDQPLKVLKRIYGWFPAGPKMDVAYLGQQVFLMKEKGKLQLAWSATEKNLLIEKCCFDGRFVWLMLRRKLRLAELAVLDPETNKLHTFGPDDGVPFPSLEQLGNTLRADVWLNPISPGRAFLVASAHQLTLAVAEFDLQKGKSVKVFHEAREIADDRDKEQWKKTTVAVPPGIVHPLGGQQSAKISARRFLIGRYGNLALSQHPLLVDIETQTVTVVPEAIVLDYLRVADSQDGSLYLGGPDYKLYGLVRFDTPKSIAVPLTVKWPVKPKADEHLPRGRIVLAGDRVNIIGEHWWTGSLSRQELHLADETPLGLQWTMRSSHYGLLIQTLRDKQLTLKQVVFQGTP